MTTMMRPAVACAWCGDGGAGICPECADAMALAEKELKAIDKLTAENLRLGMMLYLTSRWADRIDGRWICGLCGTEALTLAAACPMCGCRGEGKRE